MDAKSFIQGLIKNIRTVFDNNGIFNPFLKAKNSFMSGHKKNMKRYILCLIIFFPCLFAIFVWNLNKVSPLQDSRDYIGQQFVKVNSSLREAGFKNIQLVSVMDLEIQGGRNSDKGVISVTINGENYFSKKDKFPEDANVVINYHEFSEDYFPINLNELLNNSETTGPELAKFLKDSGFKNVLWILNESERVNPEENSIISVSIGDVIYNREEVTKYNQDDSYRYYSLDTPIQVDYYDKRQLLPLSFSEIDFENYSNFIKRLQRLGFQNVDSEAFQTSNEILNGKGMDVWIDGKAYLEFAQDDVSDDAAIIVRYYDTSEYRNRKKLEAEQKAEEERQRQIAKEKEKKAEEERQAQLAREAESAIDEQNITQSQPEKTSETQSNSFSSGVTSQYVTPPSSTSQILRPFRNCTEARKAGRVNIPFGDPQYGSWLDRDGDGFGCDD
ncbi:TPA: excalibur calcium-binding domain-containing protein [Streptococcus suis]|nr:excalibur calcium-binding domain-containing protein [Streptococcus suis]